LGEGFNSGNVSGYDKGKEYVITNISKYVTIPEVVDYAEVAKFLVDDKTDESSYSERDFDCVSYSRVVKDNANKKGIRCAVVSFDLENPQELIGHVIVAFETTDRGIVYFDPQTDGQRYDIYVGGTYTLQGVVYKITKVDVIW
jgi:hypothetical protein